MNRLSVKSKASCEIVRPRRIVDFITPKGHFTVEHWRDGKLIAVYEADNGVTIEGKNFLWDVMFHGETAAGTWYIGLIDGDVGYTALDETDDYDEINGTNGWDELPANDYTIGGDNTKRGIWNEDAASGKAMTNGTAVTFVIVTPSTVKGLFIVGLGANANLQGDHAADGKLWATALWSTGDATVILADELKVTYTVSC